MNRLGRVIAVVGATACLSISMRTHATPFVLHECQDCQSADALVTDLESQGQAYLNQFPIGTLVLMSSKEYPISAVVELIKAPRRVPLLVTADDLEGVKLDSRLYARGAKVDAIQVPPGIAPNAGGADWEVVEGYIQGNVLIPTGATGLNVFHGFLPWAFGQFIRQ